MDLTLITVSLIGVLVGSFLNVCIFRIPIHQQLFDEELYPKQKELQAQHNNKLSVSNPPRSLCPNCFTELRWFHNVPVFSWAMLGGQCAFCKNKIPVRYPLVELFSGIAAVTSFILFGLTWSALAAYILFAAFIVIACIDYDHFMIPDVITYPLTILGIIISVSNQYFNFLRYPFNSNWQDVGLGLLGGAGVLYVVAKLYMLIRKREGLGMGDIKLLAVIGAWLGLQGAFFTIFAGSVLGTIGGVAGLLLKGKGFSQEIPFGPYLVTAAAIFIVLNA